MSKRPNSTIGSNELDFTLRAFGGNWPHRSLLLMQDALEIELTPHLNWGSNLKRQEVLDRRLTVPEFEAIMALEAMVQFFCRNGRKEPAELGQWLSEPQGVTMEQSPIELVFENYDQKGVDLDNIYHVILAAGYFIKKTDTYEEDFNRATWR